MKSASKVFTVIAIAFLTVFSLSCEKTYTGSVSFITPVDKAIVTSPVKVDMGVTGMTVKPAGEVEAGTGHHHIIIDGGPIPAGTIVPSDANHIHFGKGETTAEIALSEGNHSLTLQFADGAHKSYGKAWSKTIEITVKKE